jgi:hypothetical protein
VAFPTDRMNGARYPVRTGTTTAGTQALRTGGREEKDPLRLGRTWIGDGEDDGEIRH